jgi:[acyl-carrier-protein] S-malonyltransferase
MGKIAFVFAGQGAQAPGMGKSYYDNSPAARTVLDALEAIRPGTLRSCFAGTEAELRETQVTQPCLYAVELAAAAALAEAGVSADMAAGFSLGELSALACAGALTPEEGMRLVMVRAARMQAAGDARATGMAAVLKLTNEQVESICAGFDHVYPVNYNCPGQVSCSGAAEEMEAFAAAVKAAGGRAVPLKVSGAFHSPYMAEAAAAFAAALEHTVFARLHIPVWSNASGAPYGADVRADLAPQIDHPVRWETIVRGMCAAGADTFLELGPGKTLSGFIRRIAPDVRAVSLAEYADLQSFLTEVRGC